MKLMASILSCLILALSAGAGKAVVPYAKKNQTTANVAKGCGYCCCDRECCDPGNGHTNSKGQTDGCGQTDAPANHCQRGCAFCAGSFVKGLNTSAATVPQIFAGDDTGNSPFISHKYVAPFVSGVWQPPRLALHT